MSTIEESINVEVPVRTAYNQWTQFEDFPRFMEGVKDVRQLDDTTTRWIVEVGGRRREFEAKITEQDPDQRVSWASVEGPPNAGVVTFHRLGEGRTRVMLQMEFEPDNPVEKAGDLLGMVKRRAKGDLGRFKEFIEGRGEATGAWRGEVEQDPTS